MSPVRLFSTPRVFSRDDLHAYRRAKLLNFWLLIGFLFLARSTARNFIYIGTSLELTVGILWCVLIAVAYYLFRVKHRLEFPAWVGSLSVAWIVGDLSYHNPILAAPLLLLVPLISFSLVGVISGVALSGMFSVFIIGNLVLNPPDVGSATPNAFIYNHLIALILGGGAACYLELGKQKVINTLHDSATKDELTNCWNRYVFLQSLDTETSNAQRLNTPFTLVIYDIDHFKKINDKYGHTTGDLVLKEFVEVINKGIRNTDVLARWGGEEFVLLLPRTKINEALNICERISEQIRAHNFSIDDSVTTSVGLTAYENDVPSKELIQRADIALYEAKHQGRDCIKVWKPEFETNK
ncbi:hypothetical protein BCS96_04885 [Vibrio breoganii]|nr:GGDEF domain-containing protein [Vibrio breoganii]PMG38975.1 hypothetical protein BCU93_01540 [Vibrio breoganii]PMH15033.1 hypothetical protein BCU74_14615 [Vibrio breoganii]PMK27688.1 hypothetical protein BCU03_15915 [Vibrio breoganii]PML14316.1 hypothetical protein BCT84_11770 [Vibrio breoganii]PML90467.1 hypothetical protein BCT68_04110 [Vibrio breoganii]